MYAASAVGGAGEKGMKPKDGVSGTIDGFDRGSGGSGRFWASIVRIERFGREDDEPAAGAADTPPTGDVLPDEIDARVGTLSGVGRHSPVGSGSDCDACPVGRGGGSTTLLAGEDELLAGSCSSCIA